MKKTPREFLIIPYTSQSFYCWRTIALELMMMRKKDLINKILAIELNMFQTVPSTPSECQKSPETFKTVRRSSFETWSQETLQSYLRDLNEALKKGRNLMTEKYAKIDRLAGFSRLNPRIDQIIEKEEIWREGFNQKYPHILKDEEKYIYGVPFWKVYLRAELETYSDETLESRFQDILEASSEGRSLLEESYTSMFKRIGYGSLEELELERRKEEKGNGGKKA